MAPDSTDRYVTATALDDTLGEGLRLHTDHDECYELRETGGAGVRVYGGADEWTAKIRFQDTDLDPAYDRFDAVAERLEGVYDEELITPASTFLNDAKSGSVTARSGSIAIHYNQQGRNGLRAINDIRDSSKRAEIAALAGYGGAGMTGGTMAGAATGIPELALLGFLGGAFGGAIGGLMAEDKAFPRTPMGYSIKGVTNTKTRIARWRERRKTRPGRLTERDMWDTLNEKRRLDAIAETTRDLDQARRHDDLQETGIEETVDTLIVHHFDSFHHHAGVTATISTDSYAEALDFAATVLDRDTPDRERPSIYTDVNAFRDVFEAAHEERREALVQTVLEDEAADPVKDYLDTHHEDVVQAIGGATRLHEGADTA